MSDVIAAPPQVRIPVRGGGLFPVRHVHCIGRNYADHAREMNAAVPDANNRGTPMFFQKPASALVLDGRVRYPSVTRDLHHEVELVVALAQDAPEGGVSVADAPSLIYGYAVGLDLTRRDLQAEFKTKGWPWDVAKGFDDSAPISEIVPADQVGELGARAISLHVNGTVRQSGKLDELIWNVPEILHELSQLYALRAGDLIFTGTPAGVAAIQRGDEFHASVEGVAELHGRIV